jgi:putative lipoprotein
LTYRTADRAASHRWRAFLAATALLFTSVGTAAGDAASPAGRWLAEDIRGGGVIDNLQTVLEIGASGTVGGKGGCNGIGGTATIKGTTISFGNIVSTQMACAPAVMDQEMKFLSTLTLVRSFRIDTLERKLYLLDADGKSVMRLAAM